MATFFLSAFFSVNSKEDIHANYIADGGYLVLEKERMPLLVIQGMSSLGNQVGGDSVVYHAEFRIDSSNKATKRKVKVLRDADNIVIYFKTIPQKMHVKGGEVILIINEDIPPIIFPIPPQDMAADLVFIPNIGKYLLDFK